jgi:histidinol-phosphate/aromatic aminotransferase/cobyric acid decarboxylase-like protein
VPHKTRVWIDETYVEYVGAEQSLETFAARSSHVVVCKSLSKVYALSGLRVAYLCGPRSLISPLQAITPPWTVSLPAQIAAVRALQDPKYYAERYQETHRLRDELRASLLDIGMASVVPGTANFLLCHLPSKGSDSETLLARCIEQGLFLRNPAVTSPCLGSHTVRIAVKDAATNARMLDFIGRALLRD